MSVFWFPYAVRHNLSWLCTRKPYFTMQQQHAFRSYSHEEQRGAGGSLFCLGGLLGFHSGTGSGSLSRSASSSACFSAHRRMARCKGIDGNRED